MVGRGGVISLRGIYGVNFSLGTGRIPTDTELYFSFFLCLVLL